MAAFVQLDPGLRRGTPRLQRLGLLGAWVFAACALLSTSGAYAGLILLSLTFLFQPAAWRALVRDPVTLAALAFACYVLLRAGLVLSSAGSPELAGDVREAAGDWIKLLFFIPFAYWVRGDPQRIGWMLSLALVGFVLGIFYHIDWGSFDRSFFSHRFETYLPAIAFGMFAGLGVLGLLAMRQRFWRRSGRSAKQWARVGLWALLLAVLLEGLLLSFSRGAWLAFAVAGATLMYLEIRGQGRFRPRWAFVGVLAVGVPLLLAGLHWEKVTERFSDEARLLERLSAGDPQGVPASPIGLRLHAWQFAWEKWRERPWLGWGPGASRQLVAHSGRPERLANKGHWLPHLHNTYLEVLVQFGLWGTLLLLLLLGLLVRGLYRACRDGQLAADYCRLFPTLLIFVLIWSFFNYRVVHHDWRFFWVLVAGAAYSFRLRGLFPPQGGTSGRTPRRVAGA